MSFWHFYGARIIFMKISFQRRLFALSILLTLSACASAPKTPSSTGLSYLMAPQMRLLVSRIEVSKSYMPSPKDASVEQLFPIAPSVMIQQWIRDRFSPAGGEGSALITIEEASVIEKRLPGTLGLRGLFTTDQTERYDAQVAVKVEIKDSRGYPLGYARATASASRTVSEDMTLNDRQKVFTILMEDLMNRLNQEIEKNMREYLARFIKN